MDRTPQDPPTRAGSTSMEGIAPAAQHQRTPSRPEQPFQRQSDVSEDRTRERVQTENEAERSGRAGGRAPRGSRPRGGSLQEQFPIRSFDDLQQRVREHPFRAIALAAGIGFALQRTHLLQGIGGILSDETADELTPAEERLLAWLNDAYALEKAQIPILENHAEDAESQPHVRAKDLEHLELTQRHVKLVRKCIGLLGRKPSKAKAAIGRISGAMNSLATEPFDDEIVRNFLADFASENLEIASYSAIIAAASEAGHHEIASICEEILEDEEEMAEWLRANLARAVRDTLGELDILED